MRDLFDELAERAFPRREFTLIDENFEYTRFTGVIGSVTYSTDASEPVTAKAAVTDIELVETGNKLARRGADELPRVSL